MLSYTYYCTKPSLPQGHWFTGEKEKKKFFKEWFSKPNLVWLSNVCIIIGSEF